MDLQDRPLKLGDKVPTAIYTASDEPVCVVDSMQERADDSAVARRLAACWNACMGISVESLEAMYGHYFGAVDAQRKLEAEKDRDILLSACHHIARGGIESFEMLKTARQAIKKVEG